MTTRSTFGQRIRAAKFPDRSWEFRAKSYSALAYPSALPATKRLTCAASCQEARCARSPWGPPRACAWPRRAGYHRTLAALLDGSKGEHGPRILVRPVSEFTVGLLEHYARHWIPATLESSTLALCKYILPALRYLAVDKIAFEHVRDWFAAMANRPGTTNRSTAVLSVMMRLRE